MPNLFYREKDIGMPDLFYRDKDEVISKELWKLINEFGTVTGSRAFGGYADDSDLDYIIPPNFPFTFGELINTHNCFYQEGYSANDGFLSLKGWKQNGTLVNLLCMLTQKEYQVWVKATELTIKLIDDPVFSRKISGDKSTRVHFFEAMRRILR